MKTIELNNKEIFTHYGEWMDAVDVDTADCEELINLYRTLKEVEDFGIFSIRFEDTGENKQYFVVSDNCPYEPDKVLVLSEDSIYEFWYYLEDCYLDEMWDESPEEFNGYEYREDEEDNH